MSVAISARQPHRRSASDNFVPDGIVDRLRLLGAASAHVDRPAELAELGRPVRFALCLTHDREESAFKVYGSTALGLLY
ncbi:hypothetical protein GCM10023196_048930 [Actinoallomurus vinaceus]|uniref:Uncharacterized protein n=1 Tax=Actinoallomurus vinaceus TaxID=1080074 RepID=A0ABP8UG30_9ACTN